MSESRKHIGWWNPEREEFSKTDSRHETVIPVFAIEEVKGNEQEPKMKNPDIAKTRQLLIRARQEVRELSPAAIGYPLYKERIPIATLDEALALLPCETCRGSGRMAKYNQVGNLVVGDPCPDCQPKSKENCGICPACGEYHPTSTICPPAEIQMS